ncbi:MAG: hypothetical protein J0I79_26450 [Mesorhizobium sp.]|uniref:hypothetical protein n=1 Tax=Mesorhizobium sp. TaxID=1871066 RepID=UPI001AC127D5|nr:hypothetical protein [Mesorhizobium sp.]MBN9221500.1 hypothetical protein [Mesorhizobium sp.]
MERQRYSALDADTGAGQLQTQREAQHSYRLMGEPGGIPYGPGTKGIDPRGF